MRRGFGLIGLVVTVILLATVGVIAYNVGWSEGLSTHVPEGAAVAPPYYYGYGPHLGFGIFGFLWFLFVGFVLFSVLRFAFFGRRHWGGGWGHRDGYGVPPAMDERMQEWHKRAHGEPPSTPGATPPPPPDHRSV